MMQFGIAIEAVSNLGHLAPIDDHDQVTLLKNCHNCVKERRVKDMRGNVEVIISWVEDAIDASKSKTGDGVWERE